MTEFAGTRLGATVAAITEADAAAVARARERQDRLTKPRGALGVLEDVSVRLAGIAGVCPPPLPHPAAVAVFAADHGVHAQGVTPWPQEVTAQMVANFLAGGAAVNVLAVQLGADVVVVDVGVAGPLPFPAPSIGAGNAPDRNPATGAAPGPSRSFLDRRVRPGTQDLSVMPAMTSSGGDRGCRRGDRGGAGPCRRGLPLSAHRRHGYRQHHRLGRPHRRVHRGGPRHGDRAGHRGRRRDVATQGRRRPGAVDLHRPDPADPLGVLAALGGLEHAAIAGFVLGAAACRLPVILDGVIAGAAALVARGLAPVAVDFCVAGHRSTEPGHAVALDSLGLHPLVDLQLRLGEGTGALLALPLVQAAARALRDVATFDAVGVTDKGADGQP